MTAPDLVRRADVSAIVLDETDGAIESRGTDTQLSRVHDRIRSLPSVEPAARCQSERTVDGKVVADCEFPAILCEFHGGHDSCAVDLMRVQGELADARAQAHASVPLRGEREIAEAVEDACRSIGLVVEKRAYAVIARAICERGIAWNVEKAAQIVTEHAQYWRDLIGADPTVATRIAQAILRAAVEP